MVASNGMGEWVWVGVGGCGCGCSCNTDYIFHIALMHHLYGVVLRLMCSSYNIYFIEISYKQ